MENLNVMNITDREKQVLELIGEGLSNKAIGSRLIISENTVKFHLQNIYQKLEVSNRTQAFILSQKLTTKSINNEK